MKGVVLSGAVIAVVDGVVLGVALGVDRLAVATTALAVGVVAAFVLGLVTPARKVPDAVGATGGTLITLGTRPTPEPAEPDRSDDAIESKPSTPTGPSPERLPYRSAGHPYRMTGRLTA